MGSLSERAEMMPRVKVKELREEFIIEHGKGKKKVRLHCRWIGAQYNPNAKYPHTGTITVCSL